MQASPAAPRSTAAGPSPGAGRGCPASVLTDTGLRWRGSFRSLLTEGSVSEAGTSSAGRARLGAFETVHSPSVPKGDVATVTHGRELGRKASFLLRVEVFRLRSTHRRTESLLLLLVPADKAERRVCVWPFPPWKAAASPSPMGRGSLCKTSAGSRASRIPDKRNVNF